MPKWEYGGYSGDGYLEPYLGSVNGGVAAVCGNARPVFDELEAVRRRDPITIFAVNDVGMYLPSFKFWVSLHSEKMEAQVERRFLLLVLVGLKRTKMMQMI